jgi:hypothetical protein
LRQQLKRLENCAHRVDRWLTIKHTLLTLAVTSLLTTTAFADPIHDAAMNGDIAGVTTELHKGVDVNAKDKWGGTPLHWAANRGHEEVAELLIAKGAEVDAKDSIGNTPLHLAARNSQKEIAELLIEKGADVNAKERHWGTPLHHAARGGHKEIAELLIANGADVNAKEDYGGTTPLHSAAFHGHKEIAKLLIAAGADVNAKDDRGWTPLDLAEKVYDWDSPEDEAAKKETANLLRKHGGKTSEELLMPRLVQHGRFAFSFDAKEGRVYTVQDSFDLLNWVTIKSYNGTGSSVRFDDFRKHNPPQIFYRVRVR